VPVPRWMFARMNRELERADLVVVQSRFCKESMLLNGIPAEKVMVNPLGVDVSIFKPRAEVPVRPRFISVGTICLRKGFQYLFPAFEIVKRRLPESGTDLRGRDKRDFRMLRPKWEGQLHSLPEPEACASRRVAPNLHGLRLPLAEEGIARAQSRPLAAACCRRHA